MSSVARSTSALFSPALTSSRNNSFGFIASAFASSSRLRIASVSVAADCPAFASRPTKGIWARGSSRGGFRLSPGLRFEPDEGDMRAGFLAGGFQALAGLRKQRRRGDIVERGEFGKRLHDL